MSPPTPVRGTVSGTVTGVVPGVLPPAVGSPTSCPVLSTIAAGAPDGWLNWNRTTVESLGDARGNPNGGKHGQPAQDAAPAGALGAGRYRYRERIEPAGVHALLLPQLRCNLALALAAPR